MTDPFKEIADRAHFNIYHSSLWTNTGRRFGEMIAEECARMCMSQATVKTLDSVLDYQSKVRLNTKVLNQVTVSNRSMTGHLILLELNEAILLLF